MASSNNSVFPKFDMPETQFNLARELVPDSGLTKRELFAMAALQGFLASNVCAELELFAKRSVDQADALIEALKDKPNG